MMGKEISAAFLDDKMLTLADVLEALTGLRPSRGVESIPSAVIDSRQADRGSLFIALPGEKSDGHDYVADAFERGASLALIQKDISTDFPVFDLRKKVDTACLSSLTLPCCLRVDDSLAALQKTARFWRRKLTPRVIGVTGSVGKSTTKELIADVLSQRYTTLKNPGNLNNEIGLPLTLLGLNETHERVVLEMGFYVPGEIRFLCDIALPQVGVITNIGTVHAERAGSIEAIARGKAELVESLPAAPEGVAILNLDDPRVQPMSSLTQARIFYYGLDSQADLWADGIEGLGLDGIRLRLHFRKETIHLRAPLLGRHSAHTILRAAAVGLVEGLTWQEIVDGLRSEHTQLRLVTVRTSNGALILDDTYNASPESTIAALNLLDELEGRKIAILGDMLELGQYERRGHLMVGARAAEVVDELITIGERAKIIAQAARQAGLGPEKVTEFEDALEAIPLISHRLTSQDIVLIKGSHGMRLDRIVSALEESA